SNTPAETYQRHLADARRRPVTTRIDSSRLDAEIAVRLRVTDHSRAEIVRTIARSAATARPGERPDWNAYAERATAFAFGAAGSRSAADRRAGHRPDGAEHVAHVARGGVRHGSAVAEPGGEVACLVDAVLRLHHCVDGASHRLVLAVRVGEACVAAARQPLRA